MAIVFQWSWLLAIALFGPASLPVGGAQFDIPNIRRRASSEPLLVTKKCSLYSSPCKSAPAITSLPIGTPMKILRVWVTSQGKEWIHVQVMSDNMKKSTISNDLRNGWVNV